MRQARLLRDALESAKGRIGFFLGAGCPLGIYDEKGEKTVKLIPDVANLTVALHAQLSVLDADLPDDGKFVPSWDALMTACKEGGEDNPSVEHLLTELRTITARRGKDPLGTITKEQLASLDAKICDLIVEMVGKELPKHRCSYNRFASWVGGLQRSVPVDLFTPNYDLLIEQAFEHQRVPHFDGFVGSYEPFFDIASIEQDIIPRRWTRLWKLHGSINWQRRGDGGIFRAQGKAVAGKAMIYPSHLKYDQSRRMPYLAMIDRLRAFFRPAELGYGFAPPLLVVCGYSFADEHLNEVLLDGLRGNPAAHCFALVYSSLKDATASVKYASDQPNISVLAYDGAVIGTRKAEYGVPSSNAFDRDPWIHRETTVGIGGPDSEAVRCRLGDFHYFGLFLERLYGGFENDHGTAHS